MTLAGIPTNIITGFLGVGKTTAISHLLKKKPNDERWAVLVNEFGEIGIDGSLFAGAASEEEGVFIKEVPGGCMCCAASLPMQIALNMLLARSKPDRLLIEPTGLGHPKEVIGVLNSGANKDVLHLQNTIALVDARNISDRRYTEHETFVQQLDIADVIVANKADLYEEQDFNNLLEYLSGRYGDQMKPVYPISQGQLELGWLEGIAAASEPEHHHHHHHDPVDSESALFENPEYPECGYFSINNEGEGFYSQGWVFKSDYIFDKHKIDSLLKGINVERIKGVFITTEGAFGYNKNNDVLTETALINLQDSRIELITQDKSKFENLEISLLACL